MSDKYALCVGINYQGTQAELSGCINDAHDWSALLSAEGYDVHGLTETAATKANILQQLREFVSKLGWGDRLVFTFSGHGTWVPDRDGDEADRRDEALCAIDYDRGGLLIDDELQDVFAGLRRGASALVLSDSCHSGTVSRFGMTGAARPGVPRFIPPHTFLDISEERAVVLETRPASTPRPTSSLISGCGDLEYSYDAWFGSRANGAMSRVAIDTFRSGISLSAWHKAIRERLPSTNYPQSPQLTAASVYRKYARAL